MRRAAIAVPLLLLVAACTHPAAHLTSTPTLGHILTPTPVQSPPDRPNPKLTPGAVHGTNVADVCPHVNPKLEAGRPTAAVKEAVYRAYKITSRKPGQYEIDHLIPLELDGANTPNNLWPQPNNHPRTGVLNSKDLLEDKMHRLVCAKKLPLPQAQHEIATDWVAALHKYLP